MLIVTESRHTQLTTEMQHRAWPNPQKYVRQSSTVTGFHKPDTVVVNPKAADGYRRPSSYDCPGFSRVDTTSGLHRTYRLQGEGYLRPGTADETRVSIQGLHARPVSFTAPVIDVNGLRTKLLNNVRSEVLDVAMVLAEMQGTVDLVTSGLMRLARGMDALKNRKPESFAYLMHGRRRDNRRPTDKFLRETAGTFLEWKYGVMPTISDIAGAAKALDMAEDGSLWDNPPLLVARAREVRQDSATVKLALVEAAGDSRTIDAPISYLTEYKARLDYSVSGEGLRGLNRFGIGLSTIPTLLFERTPFSFVLNMAFPLAELIKAWTALEGVDVRGYSETEYLRIDFPEADGVVTLRQIPVAYQLEKQVPYINWKRKAFPTVPMPTPYVRNPIKAGNLASVLALFTQLRRPEGYK